MKIKNKKKHWPSPPVSVYSRFVASGTEWVQRATLRRGRKKVIDIEGSNKL